MCIRDRFNAGVSVASMEKARRGVRLIESFEQDSKPVSYTHLDVYKSQGRWLSTLRAEGRVAGEFEADDVAPIYASWDLGLSDFMAIWLWQVIGGKYYVCLLYTSRCV